MPRKKYERKLEISDPIGIYKITKYLGKKEVPLNKKRDFDYFYEVECQRCGAKKEMPQRSLTNFKASNTYYCRKCPTDKIIEAKKEKANDNYAKNQNHFDEEENNLYNSFFRK